MKKIFTAFLAVFLAFSPLLSVSPTVYGEMFNPPTVSSEEQAVAVGGTEITGVENGSEVSDGSVNTLPPLETPPIGTALPATEAPAPTTETSQEVTSQTAEEKQSAVQPKTAFRNAPKASIPITTNLVDLLSNITLDAPTDADGNYIVRPNGEYTLSLQFAEKETLQMDNDQPLTYTVPVAFALANFNNTFSIDIEDSQGTATLDGNTFNITDNLITIHFNKANPALFARLSAMANVKFKLDFRGRFTGNEAEIDFGSSIRRKFTFDQTSDLEIAKDSEHVKTEGKVKYTLKVTSTGNNNNVEIVDKMEGRSLTPNQDVVVTSSKRGVLQVAPVYSEKQFTLSGINLEHEEVLTITYSATVDYNDITSPNVANESKNVALVKSTEAPDPKTVEKITTIAFDALGKYAGSHALVSGTTTQYKFPWTITVNGDQLMTVGGLEFKDDLIQKHLAYFTGTGISMVVTHENGNIENRTLAWDQLTVRKRADGQIVGWNYTPPVSDGKAKFVITAETIADASSAIGRLNINNSIRVGKRHVTPNKLISVGIAEELKPKKEIVSYSAKEALWKITIPVRPEGYNMLVRVVDDMPYIMYKGTYLHDEFVDIQIQGLQSGETYKIVNRPTGQYRGPDITFYQDVRQKVPGFQASNTGQIRHVTLLIKTNINQEWLDLAHGAGYAANGVANPVHINNASLRLGDSNLGMNDKITPKKQSLKKVFKELKYAENAGIKYPVFSYELEFTNPLDGQVISDEFDTDYLRYHQDGTLEIKGRNLEGDEFDTNGSVTPQVTSKGVNFTLTNLPKNNGQHYTTYRMTYDIIVKDTETLERLNREAFQNENNQGKNFKNVATWNGLTSGDVSVVYNYNPKLDKQLIQVPANSNRYVATFELILNEEASDLFPDSNIYTAKDELSNVLRLLPETIQVTKGNYTLDYGFDAKTNTLAFNNIPDGEEVRIIYSAHVLGSGNVSFGNTVSMGQYKKVVTESVHIASSGSGSASNPSITIVKHDKDEFSRVIPGVTFKLSYLKNGVVEDVKDKNGQLVTFTTKADGTFLIEGNQTDLGWVLWADGRTYLLTEVNTPTGYLPLEQPVSFEILETPTNTSQYPVTGGKIYVANERPKTRVEATKVWKNIGPGLVVPTTWFKLYRQVDGGALEPVPNAPIMTLAPGTNTVAWENVYAKDLNNKPYTFSVKEVDASGNEATPQDYLKEEKGLQVTNTYDGRREIEVTKEWMDNQDQDGKRPSEVTVHLYADGHKIQTAQITSANNWKHTFTNLPRFKDGQEISYTIQEDQVPGYNAPVIDGFTVTNKRIPEKTNISVQKVWEDTNNQDSIRPLHITVILKANGIEIDRKVLTAGPLGIWKHTFTDLDVYKNGVKVDYTVDEEVVPADYIKEITWDAAGGFTIKNKHTPVERKVMFSKVDLGGKEIGGAAIKIYRGTVATGNPVAEWTSVEGQSHELNLPVGKYVFHEVSAPNGYVAVTDISFQVNYDGTVTVLDANSNTVEYKDGKLVITDQYDQSPKKITFSKVNLGGEEIAGAEIEIYAGDTATGNPVAKWTSEAGKSKVIELTPGKYVFHEVSAPNGYVAVTDITFQVNYDGTVTVLDANSNTVEYKDGKLVITDQYDQSPKKITFSKVNLGGDEIAGAEIEIYAGDTATGHPVERWTSEAGKSKVIELTPGKYVFHEVSAPNGYVAVTDITFQVNYDGTVTVLDANSNTVEYKDGKLVITDQYDQSPKKITFSKVNLGGEEIEIYAGNTATGHPVERWTSEAGKSKVIELTPGKYVFHEVSAPNGYVAVTDISFQVNYDGTVTVLDANSNTVEYKDGKLVITDQYDQSPKKITFSKVNLGGDEIAGAEIEIYAGDTATGNPVEKWTSEAGKSKVIELTPGKYVFHEVSAPNGYVAVTDISFQVNYDGTVTVLDANSNTVEYKAGKLVITDQYDQSPKKITFSKVNLGGEEIAGAEIEIYAGNTATGHPVEKWTSEAGKSKVIELTPGKYVFHEVSAPNGYVAVTDITFQVNYDGTVTVLDANSNTVEYKAGKLVITDQYDETTIDVLVTKKWDDQSNKDGKRPSEVTVHLYADGHKIQTAQITSANNWKHTFTNLPRFKDGQEISYTIQEDQVPGYNAPVIDGFTVTNKRNPEKTSVSVQTVWEDANNQDGIRPLHITVILKANGIEIDRKVLTAGPLGIWKHTFTDLDVYKNGVKVDYTVDEEVVPADYIKEITGDAAGGFTIKNKHTPVERKVMFSKVNLGGKEIGGATIKIYRGTVATGNPVAEWTSVEGQSQELNLPVGKYVFHEVSAPNGYVAVTDISFQVNYDGTVTVLDANSNTAEYKDGKLVITDQYDETTIDILVTKKWDDQENKDGKRPKKIIVRLFADGQEVAHREVTADTDWKQTFTKLPKYKNGKEIVYTITEDKVDGYQTVISGNVAKGFVIQNTYTPPTPPTPPPSTSTPKGKVGRNNLPKTGDSHSLLLSGIGFIILVIGLFDYSRKKRI